jgi:epoxyqueuosine reductase
MKESNASSLRQQQISQILIKHEFERFGFTPISKPISLEYYKTWLSEGHHGSMSYLERHLPMKENPELLLKKVRSAIVVAVNYIPHPDPLDSKRFQSLRVAYYARGGDYHIWLQNQLERVASELKTLFADEEFLACSDSRPVLERDLAYRAGLGWFGKNTCLIDQKEGSFFLIGEILTTADLFETVRFQQVQINIHPDRCGTCSRCLTACPTEALIAPRVLDANKCISFLTIESKEVPHPSLRKQIGDNFFGCDICQAVCPWNEKAFGILATQEQPHLKSSTPDLEADLRQILKATDRELEDMFADTPLSRAKGFGLKRNALIVAANHRLRALSGEVQNYVTDTRLGELATWTLNEIGPSD